MHLIAPNTFFDTAVSSSQLHLFLIIINHNYSSLYNTFRLTPA